MASLNDDIRNQRPDRGTLAWFDERFAEVVKGYRGATHAVNCAAAEMADAAKRIDSVEVDSESIRKDQEWIKARIGEIQANLAKLTERVGRMADFLNKQKGGGDI